MDGTILDSMPYWRNVSKEYAMQYVDKLPDDFDERTYVMDLDECSAYFRDELGINTDAKNYATDCCGYYDKTLQHRYSG